METKEDLAIDGNFHAERFCTWPHSPEALKRRLQRLGLRRAASKITKLVVSGFQLVPSKDPPKLPAETLKLVADWIIWWRNYVKWANSIPPQMPSPEPIIIKFPEEPKWDTVVTMITPRGVRCLQDLMLELEILTWLSDRPRRNAISVTDDEFDQFMFESKFTNDD